MDEEQRLPNGITLYSAGEVYELGSYFRFADDQGNELYYDKQEWVDEPEQVMGIVLQHPELFAFYQRKRV